MPQSDEVTWQHGDIVYISAWVPDLERAATFFSAALGWRYLPTDVEGARQVDGHQPHQGILGEVSPATLFSCFAVTDLAAACEKVRDAGGTAEEPHKEPYGYVAQCTDPGGTAFALAEVADGTPVAGGANPGSRPGDVAHLTMEVTDSAPIRAFYETLLGWDIVATPDADTWHVNGVRPMVGITGSKQVATNVAMYRVEDISTTIEQVRKAGGQATDPTSRPWGQSSVCSDDQGTRFFLGQF